MTDEDIVKRAKDAEKRTDFGELVHSSISKGINSAYGIGFIEGMVEYRNSLQEESASEDLEEAAENAIPECMWGVDVNEDGTVEDGYDRNQMISMFKAGANWQKQQTLDSNALLYNARMEGIEIGKSEAMSKVRRYLDAVNIDSDDYYDQLDDCYDMLCELTKIIIKKD